MRHVTLVAIFVLGVGWSEAQADHLSVTAGKAVVAAGKATVEAVRPIPGWTWRGLRWVAAHI